MTTLTAETIDVLCDVLACVCSKAGPLHKIARACRIAPGQCLDALNHLIEAGHIERSAVVAHIGARHREIFYRERFT